MAERLRVLARVLTRRLRWSFRRVRVQPDHHRSAWRRTLRAAGRNRLVSMVKRADRRNDEGVLRLVAAGRLLISAPLRHRLRRLAIRWVDFCWALRRVQVGVFELHHDFCDAERCAGLLREAGLVHDRRMRDPADA